MLDREEVKARAVYLPRDNKLLNTRLRGLLSRITTIKGLGQAFDWLIGELIEIAMAAIL